MANIATDIDYPLAASYCAAITDATNRTEHKKISFNTPIVFDTPIAINTPTSIKIVPMISEIIGIDTSDINCGRLIVKNETGKLGFIGLLRVLEEYTDVLLQILNIVKNGLYLEYELISTKKTYIETLLKNKGVQYIDITPIHQYNVFKTIESINIIDGDICVGMCEYRELIQFIPLSKLHINEINDIMKNIISDNIDDIIFDVFDGYSGIGKITKSTFAFFKTLINNNMEYMIDILPYFKISYLFGDFLSYYFKPKGNKIEKRDIIIKSYDIKNTEKFIHFCEIINKLNFPV